MNENKRLKRKVRTSYAISTLSIALVLFLAGAAAFTVAATVRAAATLQNSVTLIVELSDDMNEAQREELCDALAQNEIVSQIGFSSKQDKLQDEAFRKVFAVEFEQVLGENPLLDSYEVQVAATADNRDALEALVGELNDTEGVEHVSYPVSLVDTMHKIVDRVRPVLFILALVMIVISLTLLNTTVRLAIYSRRYIINTMKLVGATKWFIVKPFVGSSIKQGIVAGVLAALLFGGAVFAAEQTVPEAFTPQLLTTAAIVTAAMVAAGILLSALFTLFAVNKFVNMKSNKIYLY